LGVHHDEARLTDGEHKDAAPAGKALASSSFLDAPPDVRAAA
jgi:hypothetical protein